MGSQGTCQSQAAKRGRACEPAGDLLIVRVDANGTDVVFVQQRPQYGGRVALVRKDLVVGGQRVVPGLPGGGDGVAAGKRA